MDYLGRLNRAQAALAEAGLDALLVSRMSNIRYLTGFTGSLGYLLLGTSPLLIVDGRYGDQAAAQAVGVSLEVVESSTLAWPTARDKVRALRGQRVGFEGDTLSAAAHEELRAGEAATVVTRGLVERLRWVKDAEEIAELSRAVKLTDLMLADLLPLVHPGLTELEIAGHVELLQFRQGGLGSASPIIASSGPRTAIPHGLPTPRLVGAGEPLMIDAGTTSAGYGADTTRTYHLGPPAPKFREIYGIVLESVLAGIAAVRPGLTGRQVDAVARDVIDKAGYGPRFGHSLGHSIGLDYHEKPLLSPFDETVLEPGMVLTVEPGIYLDGIAGVRIEDMVLVTEDGCTNLTSAPKELIEL